MDLQIIIFQNSLTIYSARGFCFVLFDFLNSELSKVKKKKYGNTKWVLLAQMTSPQIVMIIHDIPTYKNMCHFRFQKAIWDLMQ